MVTRFYCPHCNAWISTDRGTGVYRIESPLCICQRCKKPYIRSKSIEWDITHPFYKFWFIFLANDRWALYILPGVCTVNMTFQIGLPVAILILAAIVALLYVYFRCRHKDDIKESKARCADDRYVKLVLEAGYDYVL